jgi:hypothetical protein
MFDKNYKLLLKILWCNNVRCRQIIDDYEDNPVLKMNNSDKVALNLKLKGKKNIWFGNVTLGAG